MNILVNKTFKNVISSIIAIVTMFSIIATMSVVFFKTTLINENTYKSVFEKVGTYDDIVESINDNIGYTLVVYNIDKNILKDVISKEEVVDIIDSTIDSFIGFLKGKASVLSYDKSIYEKRIDDAINNYLRDNSMYLNEDQKSDIENIKESLLNIIDSDLQIINFSELSKSNAMILVSKIVSIMNNNMVLVGCLVTNILLLSLFFPIWKRRRARAYAWIGYTSVSAGMILFLLSFSGYISKFYEYAIIAIPYVAKAVGFIIKKYLFNMSIIGIVVTFIGFFYMSFYWKHLYRRYTKKSKVNEEDNNEELVY